MDDDDDFYGVLGVPSDANPSEIRRNYLERTRRLHPDKTRGLNGHAPLERLHTLQNAYNVVVNPFLRRIYDRYGPGPALDIARTLEPTTASDSLVDLESFERLVASRLRRYEDARLHNLLRVKSHAHVAFFCPFLHPSRAARNRRGLWWRDAGVNHRCGVAVGPCTFAVGWTVLARRVLQDRLASSCQLGLEAAYHLSDRQTLAVDLQRNFTWPYSKALCVVSRRFGRSSASVGVDAAAARATAEWDTELSSQDFGHVRFSVDRRGAADAVVRWTRRLLGASLDLQLEVDPHNSGLWCRAETEETESAAVGGSIAVHLGVASGLSLQTRYSLAAPWIDDYSRVLYNITLRPATREVQVALGISRAGTVFEIPLLLAWPTSPSSPQGSAGDWALVVAAAAAPLVMHGLWKRCIEDSPLHATAVRSLSEIRRRCFGTSAPADVVETLKSEPPKCKEV